MIQKIKAKNFVIKDFEVIDFMRSNKVSHIRFKINIDEGVYISIEFPDNKNTLTFGKDWFKVKYGFRYASCRTPSFLLDHKGRDVDVYKVKSPNNEFEMLRIKPIGFDVSEIRKKIKIPRISPVPFFSKSGYLFIPKDFVRKNFNSIDANFISFNRTNNYIVKEGFIFCRITDSREGGWLSYPINEHGNGLRTRKLLKLSEIIFNNGKDLNNFQYKKIIHDEDNDSELIIFEEVFLDD